jgi:hypothetical protein
MNAFSGSLRAFVCAGIALSIVAGCGGSQNQTSSLVPNQNASVGRLGAQVSAMAPDAATRDLLYVAHAADGSVSVYSYPEGKLEGRLDSVRADGLCSDTNGDVFIPEGNQVLEYAHNGMRPMATLRGSLGGAFQFCSVDPKTGNLAVSGGEYPHLGVAIYAAAKGAPQLYKPSSPKSGYWSSAYDSDGNLFVERFTRERGKHLAIDLLELPKGGVQFAGVAWTGTRPSRLGSIQWDGAHLAVETPSSTAGSAMVYRYAVSSGRAAFVDETALQGAGNPAQLWIHGGQIVVPNAGGVQLFAYPAGGAPSNAIKDTREPAAVTVSLAPQAKFAITTYHYDNLRTGWNDNESTLSAKNVKSGSFGLLHTVTLDDQVDVQPLVVPGETTTRGTSPGKHDVAYVETENDTVYAIDASTGTVLFSQSLGTPVQTPLGCNNNGPNVGIDGTPVIDLAANVMYVIAYDTESSVPTYRIHELSLADLSDVVPSVVVAASHKLTNGTTYTFNATYQRQRPGLLEANGNVYAGFGSFCDFSASVSRGWLLGWQTGSLAPLAANQLNDSLATSPDDFFLSSIWMSGYGVAADPTGNLYFVTGNSDPGTYTGDTNIQESVVKVSADLTQLLSVFTPSNQERLDQGDVDFGSGGVMLLPTLGSSVPSLAAAAGKNGTMFLLNQSNLGGYNPSGPNNDLDAKPIGGCWCGQSYFGVSKNSNPHIVASGGNTVTLWRVKTSPTVKLVLKGSSARLPGAQDPGFFTTVSSNGTKRGAIIWALARPQYVPGNITLFAISSEPASGSLPTLWQGTAGSWATSNGNANLVPVVANGKVFVASYKQLDIFGLGGTLAKAGTPHAPAFHPTSAAPNEVTGTLLAASGSSLTLRTRTGTIVRVDASVALRQERSGDLVVGEPFNVRGKYDAARVLHAVAIVRAKPSESTWLPDR